MYLKDEKYAYIFGIISGMLGGAYNSNGPPIIIYGSLRKWEPAKFRSILQGIFFPTNLMIIATHGAAGLWTADMWRLFLFSSPVVIVAVFIGSKLNKLIPSEKFNKYIYLLIILISLILFVDTVF
jgi:hypothetical protein